MEGGYNTLRVDEGRNKKQTKESNTALKWQNKQGRDVERALSIIQSTTFDRSMELTNDHESSWIMIWLCYINT